MYTTCSELFLYWTRNSANTLSSYFGLTEVKMSASEKDIHTPVYMPVDKLVFGVLTIYNFECYKGWWW